MRVHPTVLQGAKSQLPIYFGGGAIVLLVLVNLFSKDATPAAPIIPMRMVAVAKVRFEPKQPITAEGVGLEQRTQSELPADVVGTLEELKDKIAIGIIPAGYPISMSMIAEVGSLKDSEPTPPTPPPVVDPCEEKLTALRAQLLLVNVGIGGAVPPKCTKIALTVLTPLEGPMTIVGEATVAKTEGGSIGILVNPDRGQLMDEAKFRGGQFSYVEIPAQGPNPYKDREVFDLDTLKRAYVKEEVPSNTPPPPPPEEQCKGYVRDGDKVFCMTDQGNFEVNPDTGELIDIRKQVFNPKKDKKLGSAAEPKNNSPDEAEKDLTGVGKNLSLFPLTEVGEE